LKPKYDKNFGHYFFSFTNVATLIETLDTAALAHPRYYPIRFPMQVKIFPVCMTTSGSVCIFPYNLTKGSESSKCYWDFETKMFLCPNAVFLDGIIDSFEVCETNCPVDCKENYWNCKGECIPDTKPCGNFCFQGKLIFGFVGISLKSSNIFNAYLSFNIWTKV